LCVSLIDKTTTSAACLQSSTSSPVLDLTHTGIENSQNVTVLPVVEVRESGRTHPGLNEPARPAESRPVLSFRFLIHIP
jgi:hypothetical protein